MVSDVPKMTVFWNFVTKSKLKVSLAVWRNLLPYIFQGVLQPGSPSRQAAPGQRKCNDASVYNIRKLDFQANICETFAAGQMQHYYGELVLGRGVFTRLFSTIREKDFNQNVGEVAYSIFLAVYWPIAQNVGTWLGKRIKYTFILTSCNVATMVANNSTRYFFPWRLYCTLYLCWMHWFVSHLIQRRI